MKLHEKTFHSQTKFGQTFFLIVTITATSSQFWFIQEVPSAETFLEALSVPSSFSEHSFPEKVSSEETWAKFSYFQTSFL